MCQAYQGLIKQSGAIKLAHAKRFTSDTLVRTYKVLWDPIVHISANMKPDLLNAAGFGHFHDGTMRSLGINSGVHNGSHTNVSTFESLDFSSSFATVCLKYFFMGY